jgi:hypothetical protein
MELINKIKAKIPQGDFHYWLTISIWLAVGVTLTVATFASIWLIINQPQQKTFTGVNYYRYPVTVKIEDKTYTLQMFDTYSHITNSSNDVSVQIYNDAEELLDQRTHLGSKKQALAFDIIAPATPVKICPSLIDVTEIFYPVAAKQAVEVYPVDYPFKSPTGLSAYVEFGLFEDFYKLLSISNYSGKELPQNLSSDQKIYGLYLVECDNLTDSKKLTQEVLWWTNYTPQAQRTLYQAAQQKLESTPEYRL